MKKVLFVTALLVISCILHAQVTSTKWRGTTSSSWATASNWTAGVPTATVDAIIGDSAYVNAPTASKSAVCKNLTIGGTVAATLTVSKSINVNGNIIINSNGTINQGRCTISLLGNWSNAGTYNPTNNSANINFKGTGSSITGITAFKKLTINTGASVTLTNAISTNAAFAVNGSFDPSTYLVTVSSTLTVGAAGVLKVNASTSAGNYGAVTPTSSIGGTIEYASASSQVINTGFTYSVLKLSGIGTRTLSGSALTFSTASTSYGSLYITEGTLNLGSGSANRSGSGGVLSISKDATLQIGGSGTFPTGFATHSLNVASTVEYNGSSAQVVAAPLVSYGKLVLSGSGNKTSSASFTVSGAFSMTGNSISYTPAAAITFAGNITLNSTNTLVGGASSHTVAGNIVNNGAITSTGTFTLNGSNNNSISGSGSNGFNNLTITTANNTIDAATNVTVAGTLTTSGSGTLTHTAGAGILTMSGTGSITGSGITLSNLSCSGTTSTTSTFTVTGNLAVTGTYNQSAGVLTMSGTGKTITGGTITFYGLMVSGTVTTTANFSVANALNVATLGSFTASSPSMATFSGTSALNGTANLYNATLNAALTLSSSAVLGLSGPTNALTIGGSGSLNTSTYTPNTVNFNGATQNINNIAYNNLTITNAGTKTATAGAITVNGDLIISSGATFAGSTFTHTIAGNWTNNGTFTQGGSTISFTGAADASIGGSNSTTFNILTINKSSSTNVVTLANSISVPALNMTLGTMSTGSNTVTITADRSGSGIILGNIRRTHSFNDTNKEYEFEGQANTIKFSSTNTISSILVTVTKGAISDFTSGGSMNRQYTIAVTGTMSPATATLKLHYEDAELAGNNETAMTLWKNTGSGWSSVNKTTNDATTNYVSLTALNSLDARWTLSETASIITWNGSQSNSWTDPLNWTPNTVPTSSHYVEIGKLAFTNNPSIASAVSIRGLQFGSAQAATLTLTSGSLTTTGNISGIWSANQTHTIAAGNQNITVGGDLVLSDGTANHTIDVTAGTGTIGVAGNLTQSGNAGFTFSGAGNLSVGGDYNYSSSTPLVPSTATVTYNGTGAQAIAGAPYYNLTINKATGIATASSALTIGGNLNVTAGEIDLNNTMNITGNLTIASSGIFKNFNAITVAGNWTNNGSFIGSGSTTTFNGTGSQTVSNTTFNGLLVNKTSGTLTLASAVGVKGDLTITAGTVDLSTFTINRTTTGGAFSLANGAILKVGGASNFPSSYSTYTLGSSSTVDYTATVAQAVNSVTYGNLSFSNAGTKTLGASIAVYGDLTINSGATFDGSSYTIDLYGNWVGNGTYTPSTSTVLFEGATNKSVSGTGTLSFYRSTFYGNYTINNSLSYSSGFRVATGGTFNMTNSALTLTLAGSYTNNGSVTSLGAITFTGTSPISQAIATRDAIVNTFGRVNFNGTVAPTFTSNTSTTAGTWNINNTGGISPSSNWIATDSFNVASGARFNGGVYTHTFKGSFINNGTVSNSSGGNLYFNPTSAQTAQLMGTAFTANGTVTFGGSALLTVTGTPTTLTDVVIDNTVGVSPASNWNIGQSFTVKSGAIFNSGSNNYQVGGDITSNGTLFGNTSTYTLTSPLLQLSFSNTSSFNNLTISSTAKFIANTDFNVRGDFKNNGVYDADSTVGTLNMTGGAAASMGGNTSILTIPALNINKTSNATVTLSNPLSTIGTLDITAGIFDIAGLAVTQDNSAGASNSLTIAGDGTLRIGGTTNKIPSFTTYTLDTLSTVDYYGSNQTNINQTDNGTAVTYGNLTISGGNSKTTAVALTIAKNFTISGGGFTGSSFTHKVGGNWTMTAGTFTNTGTTIEFNGTSTQTVSSTGAFNNLTVNSAGITLGSAVTVSGALAFTTGKITIGANDLTLAGSISGSGSTRYIVAESTGSVVQSIASGNTKAYPVGTTSAYLPATLQMNSGTTDNFSVRVIGTAYVSGSSGAIKITGVVNATWEIAEGTNGGSSNTLTLQWPAALEQSFNRNLAKLAHYSGSAWDYGSTIPVSGTDPSTITRSGFTSFSPFSVRNDNTVLPVTWLSVAGKRIGNDNEITWSTATETNNARFEVQSSVTGIVFTPIGQVAGAGNTTTVQHYRFIDRNPLQPVVYYRIKQVDDDGRASYSAIVKIAASEEVSKPLTVSPNPVSTNAVLSFSLSSATTVRLVLSDAAGHILYNYKLAGTMGKNTLPLCLEGQPAGVYFIELLEADGGKQIQRIVKK